MRYILIILFLFAISTAEAQRKFGKVYSAQGIFMRCDSIIRHDLGDTIYRDYIKFLPDKSRLFIRFDTVYIRGTPFGKREEKDLKDITIPFTEVTRYPAPFWAYLCYQVCLPEHPEACTITYAQIEFYKDTSIFWNRYDQQSVTSSIPYSRRSGAKSIALLYSPAMATAFDTAKNILLRTFGAETYERCFSIHKDIQSATTPRLQKDGAFFVTPSADTFMFPASYEFWFIAHPPDLPKTGRDFVVGLDRNMHFDSASFFHQMNLLPDCIRYGKTSHTMNEAEAIECAIANGVPKAKESYKNRIYQAGKNYEWEIFSIQSSKHHTDLIGHPCDTYTGIYIRLDAVTKKVLSAPAETSYQEGCMD